MHTARKATDADPAAARAAEALRRAGGALPVDRLQAALESDLGEPLARALRRRSDLFLLIEGSRNAWQAPDWSPAERLDYERARRRTRSDQVVLIDGAAAREGVRAPLLLRESLLSLWGDDPQDEHVRRELAQAATIGASPAATSPVAG